ncbi:MAG: helix-turn-helix domain-containing protein [Anaerobacillus sp.]|uniref:helix-turn-helix domain-containing protein n=1 Tax=Anaerobacillus sp. TaxID=1872506 RepID=UPI00391B8E3D
MSMIGQKIKELRMQHGMTLKELGGAINFNYSNLSKIERGNRKPAIDVLESLSNYFNIDIAYFFSSPQKTHSKTELPDIELIHFTKELKQKNISLQELRELVEKIEPGGK